MGQHYIPQYYLKGFASSPDLTKIWVYQKGSDVGFSAGIGQVANENNRWTSKVEDHLANNIENPANKVLDKIRNREKLDQQNRNLLALYITNMYLRVPQGLNRMKEHAPEILDEIHTETRDTIYKLLDQHPEKTEILNRRLIELPEIISKFKEEFPRSAWYQNLIKNSLERVQHIIPKMK